MTNAPHSNGTEIEMDVITEALEQKDMAGMPPLIALLKELYGIQTYEQLIPALKKQNQFGHFQLETSDLSTYNRIMGADVTGMQSNEVTLIVDKEIIVAMVEVIRETMNRIRQETRQNIDALLRPTEEDNKKEPAQQSPRSVAA